MSSSSSTTTHPPTRITVLISGNGTNLQALIDATQSTPPTLPSASIIRVLSNRRGAHGLTRAQNAGIPTTYHNLLAYKKKHTAGIEPSDTGTYEAAVAAAREAYDEELARLLVADGPHVVVCAGWMHVLSERFLGPVHEAGVEIINLHPARPGEYNGANAIERAHADWVAGKIKTTGVMVHRVIGEVDMGEPLVVQDIEFQEGDEEIERLEGRIHEVEWGLIVKGTGIAIKEYWRKKGESV